MVSLLFCIHMLNGLDMQFEGEISEEIRYKFERQLMPIIARSNNKYKKINVISQMSNLKFDANKFIGCGFSGGVDSFCCLNRNSHSMYKSHNITHVCVFDFPMGNNDGLVSEELFHERKEKIEDIAEEKNLKCIGVRTNINEFYDAITARWVHTAYTVGIILCIQKMFSKYFFASNYVITDVNDTTNAFDDHWGTLVLDAFSNQNITFYLESMDLSRTQKMQYVVNDDVAQKYLSVCGYEYKNCGICEKCVRTQVTLDIMGNLDEFREVFDLKKYKKKECIHKARMYGRRKQSAYYKDVQKLKESLGVKYPFKSYIYAPFFRFTGWIRFILMKDEMKNRKVYTKLRLLYRKKLKKYM